MGQLDKLETKLHEFFTTKIPFQLPPDSRKALAKAFWWIALVIGILQLWAAIALWRWGHAADRAVDRLNDYLGTSYVVNDLGIFYYLAVIAMAVVAVLFLLASPNLKDMRRSGWKFLFYAVLVGVGVAVLRLFSEVGGGIGSFLGAALGALIGAYFLFQVQEYFTAGGMKISYEAHKPAAHNHHDKVDSRIASGKEDNTDKSKNK
jgi:drug/metabolite transporter (DMT)-like permease